MHFRQMFTNSSTFTNLYLFRTDIAYIGKLAERGLLKDANEVGRAGKKIFYFLTHLSLHILGLRWVRGQVLHV